jgi:hypothetical protein
MNAPPRPLGSLLTFLEIILGALPLLDGWQSLVAMFHSVLCAIHAWEFGVMKGGENVLKGLSNKPRESRMGDLDFLFDLYKLDPREFRHDQAAMVDPPREGLDGVWQQLVADEKGLPTPYWYEPQRHRMWDIT